MLVKGCEGSKVTEALARASLATWSTLVVGTEINSGVALENGGRFHYDVGKQLS